MIKYNIIFDKKNELASSKAKQLKFLLKDQEYNSKKFDYLFIIGGDGNFLKFARQYLNNNIKIIFINAGTLGFYSYINDLKQFNLLDVLNDNNYIHLDLINIQNNKNQWYAINDFSIYSNYAINLNLYINNILVETMKSNGILIATPMGSTARNKSLSGPIVFPDNKVFIITEIEPIHNHFYNSLSSSIVINNQNTIKVNFCSFKKYNLIVDGNVYEKTLDQDEIIITHSISKAKVLIKIDTKSWSNKLNNAFK